MPLSYIGGKSKISKWIIPHIPQDTETYVEVFGGMMWVYFNMDLTKYPNLKKIVYNDFNPLNYNLFQCLKNPSKLLEVIDSIPSQQKWEYPTPNIYKEQFISFQNEIYNKDIKIKDCDYDIAAKYVYILSQVFSGCKPETSSFIDLKGMYKSKYLTFRDKLLKPDWVEHFIKITHIENMDFEELIKKYDSPQTYLYTDPPYYKTENYYNNHDFDTNDHIRLSDCLKKVEGKFSLSYYDFPQLQEWFSKEEYVWEKKLFAKSSSAKKGKTQNMGEELLIMNYNINK